MRFTLVDRIMILEPGVKIKTIKTVSLAEEYLADHFPRFPVMPGVMMLEAMTQSGAWLVRVTDDFVHSIVTLKQARNVRFKSFVAPGQVLVVSAEMVQHGPRESQLEVQGTVADDVAVSGRLVLQRHSVVDLWPELAPADEYIRRNMRDLLSVLYQPISAGLVH
ncbi:MAG: beta-hydroxyacyl-ACP dehydratase [Planctomycetia bacterium]|nr:beta-hydroxyacyl-ACP dehydratase [Planctomycetia bacterium]